jgi:hypothetical protein
MKTFGTNFLAVLSVGLMLGGTGLLFSAAGPQVLSVEETRQVTGGTINGVKLVYANCPPATNPCSFILCDQVALRCPNNTAERYQTFPTYPQGTAAGSAFETTVPANYLCNQHRFCSNPCNQSTQGPNFLWYCGGAVGPVFNDPPLPGAQGGIPFSPEA